MKLRLWSALATTESEYRANLAGLNTFFGAVLGFVISGVEQLDTFAFTQILVITSAAVISILYMSASHNRLLYAVMTVAIIFMLPRVMPDDVSIPAKLQPTLFVWAVLTLIIEFMPRRPDPNLPPKA